MQQIDVFLAEISYKSDVFVIQFHDIAENEIFKNPYCVMS